MDKGILKLYDESKYIWVLDAGHGNTTPGKRSPVWGDGSQLFEWEYNRGIRKHLIDLLDTYKISYYIDNPEDNDISLSERVRRINDLVDNQNKEVIVVSIHGNAAGVESANGYEIFTSPGETKSDKIATIFYEHAEKTRLFKMRKDYSDGDPDKEAKYYILVHTKCPAVLTESGFYTNEEECKKMLSDNFRISVAVMHFTAILDIEQHGY